MGSGMSTITSTGDEMIRAYERNIFGSEERGERDSSKKTKTGICAKPVTMG